MIAYLDSDNFWHHDHTLWALATLEETGAHSLYTAVNIHNLSDGWSRIASVPYDRQALLRENFIDLNALVHDRALLDRAGGFDTDLTRLVDWDFILRLTADHTPLRLPVATVEYILEAETVRNISYTAPLEENRQKVQAKHATEMAKAGVLEPDS